MSAWAAGVAGRELGDDPVAVMTEEAPEVARRVGDLLERPDHARGVTERGRSGDAAEQALLLELHGPGHHAAEGHRVDAELVAERVHVEDRVAVEDAAVDPQGDRLELRPDALAGIGPGPDPGAARAEDVPAFVADVVFFRDGQERVRRDLVVIRGVERALVEIVPGQVAALGAEIAAVEGPVEPPGRARRRAERGRPGGVLDAGLDLGVELPAETPEGLGVAVDDGFVAESGDGDEVLRAEYGARPAAAEVAVAVGGETGEIDEVPTGRADGQGGRSLEPGRERFGDDRRGPGHTPARDRLEETVLGIEDAAGAADDLEAHRAVRPAVDDDLVEPGPLEHVGEKSARARVGDEPREGLVAGDPGGRLRRTGHRADERAGAAPGRGHGGVVQGGRADDDPVPGRERVRQRARPFEMVGQQSGLEAAAADVVAGISRVGRFDPDRPFRQVDESPAAPVSGHLHSFGHGFLLFDRVVRAISRPGRRRR